MRASQVVGSGVGELIREAVPAWLIPAFVVLTELGNVGVFLSLFALDYWFGDRERGAHAIGLAVAGMALITALKALFVAPRPPEEVNVIPISGYSFPSGHALGATIAYGILAFDLEVGTARLRYAAAALVVGLVALSRVVLGVHFVRDVVAGVAIGIAFLAVAITLTGRVPRLGFLLAVGLGVVAFAISGASQDGVAVLGAALGAALAWEALDATPAVDSRWGQAVLVGGVLPALAGLGYASTLDTLSPAAVFVLSGAVMVGILLAPLFVARVS